MNDLTMFWRRYWKQLFLIILGGLLFSLMVYGAYIFFTSKTPGSNDFYPRWKGAQLFWQGGIDPYSQTATEAIQWGMYGRLATPEEDQVLFVYPFYVVFLLIPFIGLEYAWVQAIWLVTVLFSLIGGVFLILRLIEWEPPFWLLFILLVWSVVYYNSVRTIILGQFAGLIFFCIAGCLLALKHKRDGLAGALLFWTTLKPQMSFLIIPALLIWAVKRRRWRFITALGGIAFLFICLSFILLPSWLNNFVMQVGNYPAYTFTGSPLWVITGYYWPQLGKPVEWSLIALLLLYLLWQWRNFGRETADSSMFLFIISLTLIITNVVIVRTATTNYVIMYLPLLLLLKNLSNGRSWGNLLVTILIALISMGMWILFLTTIEGNLEHPITYLPMPVVLLAVLIWSEKRCFFHNPTEVVKS